MKELIALIAKALVDKPEEVVVTEKTGEGTHIIQLKVGAGDLGKVIGKSGRNADAIRTILAAASGKTKKRYFLDLLK